jgi:hypothetical protein
MPGGTTRTTLRTDRLDAEVRQHPEDHVSVSLKSSDPTVSVFVTASKDADVAVSVNGVWWFPRESDG